MKFKKDKEYILQYDNHNVRIIITKVTTLADDSKQVFYKDCNTDIEYDFNLRDKQTFLKIIEPVSCTEMFTMYVNWNNFYKKGPMQDLDYASNLHKSIFNTLFYRSFIKYGSGKFEDYDYLCLKTVLSDWSVEVFGLSC